MAHCLFPRVLLCLLFSLPASAADPNSVATLSSLVSQVSVDSLETHIRHLAYAGGDRSRVTFTRGNDSAAAYIRRTFDRTPGLTSVVNDTFSIPANPPWNQKRQINIIATFEGRRTPEQVFAGPCLSYYPRPFSPKSPARVFKGAT